MVPNSNYYNYMNPINNNYANKLIKVEGNGYINTQPDTAIITMGVIKEDISAKQAQQDNKIAIENIINGLNELGIKNNNIKTIDYSIYPRYDYIDNVKTFRGYEIKHLLEVTVNNINDVGIVLEQSIENGANYHQGVTFTVNDFNKYYQDALDLAVLDAKKADGPKCSSAKTLYYSPGA